MTGRPAALAAAGVVLLLSGTAARARPPRHAFRLGYSVRHRPIMAQQFGHGSNLTLILGGMHGDEPAGSAVVGHLGHTLAAAHRLPPGAEVILVPKVNPDGLARDTRVNADGVDINRNFPTRNWRPRAARPRYAPGPKPASEPETRIVMRLIAKLHPCRIITIHAPYHQLNIDGPARPLARAMQRFDHYRITTSIGYPTPGSLGAYAGRERHIPVVTLELPPVSGAAAWAENRDALLAAIRLPCR